MITYQGGVAGRPVHAAARAAVAADTELASGGRRAPLGRRLKALSIHAIMLSLLNATDSNS